jgi:hypothetical protein
MKEWVVVIGDPFSGMQIIGPFTHDELYEFTCYIDHEWKMVKLVTPEDYERRYEE